MIFFVYGWIPRQNFTFLNSGSPDLKFSVEYDIVQVHFLDMWIKLINGSLTTTLYQEMDRNTLLHAGGAHPGTLGDGLPKSQYYCLRRICHSTDDSTLTIRPLP
uniref:Uncharacterized protein n=1 Tax=Anguilla anguilla TaxID=7936 RepID=A0A0E9XS53_ANGAN